MAGVVRKEMLVMTNIDGNNNKFWAIELMDDHSVHVTNGRVGTAGQKQPARQFGGIGPATKFLESKIREKIRGGYVSFKAIDTGDDGASKSRMALEMAASEQIRTRDASAISDLVARLIKANIHSIVSNSDLKYDEDSGLFQTPLGIVTLESIDEARVLLANLGNFVAKQDFDSPGVKADLASYLMLIPQKVGRKLIVKDVIPDAEAIQKQNSLLDDLEASVGQLEGLKKQRASQKSEVIEVPKVFSCAINVVTDKSVLDAIERLYASTAQRMHKSYGYKIRRVYEVQVDHMHEAYEKGGKSVGNVMRLWHGTRPGNVLSILKSGLIIPRSNAPHVCGRMFADGAYFSDQSTKSLNYATGWWAGAYEKECFMFLADVAMGRSHTPRGPSQNLPKPGSDSTFAKAGESGVQNNEMIVYRTEQADLKYLVEFEHH